MIIFGMKAYATLLATLSLVCPQCHNPAAHRLNRVVTKFTLFFIPLFPVSTKHMLDCTFCGLRRNPTTGEAKQLAAYAAAQQNHPQGPSEPQAAAPAKVAMQDLNHSQQQF